MDSLALAYFEDVVQERRFFEAQLFAVLWAV
ncbi:MAG: hypothetical protein BWY63_01308 [Chloroflexi bacterium ADurb.Bin360]|nr:MAG: hypothetical protein BWY63_01308 [Chloroflexi bacterium ADurb.Bin360]